MQAGRQPALGWLACPFPGGVASRQPFELPLCHNSLLAPNSSLPLLIHPSPPCRPPSPPAAAVSIYATGQVLHQTHDWSLVFEVAAGLYLFGAVVYLSNASCEEQFADVDIATTATTISTTASSKAKAQ